MSDIIIIGAGIIGCAVARELSRYHSRITVLEKENDVACGTSKANSGIVHAGFDAAYGTLKAKYNVLGNQMFARIASELDFPFIRCGALVLAFTDKEVYELKRLYSNGLKNGVKDLSLLTKEEALNLESNISSEVKGALLAPTSGIAGPYEATIAYAVSAALNEVDFVFNAKVIDVVQENEHLIVVTENKKYRARVVINCAGVDADVINNMIVPEKIKITPRKGEYLLLDRAAGLYTSHTIFTLPTKTTKGVLVTPAVHGNTIVGPTADDTFDREDTATTGAGLDEAWTKGLRLIPSLNKKAVITQFAGLRAQIDDADFIVGFSSVPGFYNLAGIASPGLSCAPALAVKAARDISEYLKLRPNQDFIEKQQGIPVFSKLSLEEKAEKIKRNPQYANIVCRCEAVSEGEIVEAIQRTPGARDLDGIKRRTRAGMGRCQSGFCLTRVAAILARELSVPFEEVTKHGARSQIVVGKANKE